MSRYLLANIEHVLRTYSLIYFVTDNTGDAAGDAAGGAAGGAAGNEGAGAAAGCADAGVADAATAETLWRALMPDRCSSQ